MKRKKKNSFDENQRFLIAIGLWVVGILFVSCVVGLVIYTSNHQQKQIQNEISEPNYYGLALMGLVPANQEDAHPYWEGDIDTGVIAVDSNGREYHLIKDVFGRTFLR